MRFESRTLTGFWNSFDKLPVEIQEQAVKQYDLFCEHPWHPSLRLKPAGPFWSVRISLSYRALAIRRGDTLYWFWIGTHADFDESLKNR